MDNTRLPKIASVQAKQLGARNILDECERIGLMEKHNMKYNEFHCTSCCAFPLFLNECKIGDMTINQWKRIVNFHIAQSTN